MPTLQEQQLSELARPGMNGSGSIRQILHPGKYAYTPGAKTPWKPVDREEPDVAARRKHNRRKPKLVRFDGVAWYQHEELSWAAYMSSAPLNHTAPIDEADDATLGYYNCRLLQPGDVISIDQRSMVTDFCYGDEYFERYVLGANGCSTIEQHDFAHVDMPLDGRSGLLVIGRIDQTDQVLELTAFRVRPGCAVYIPAKTIHTNDYLLGRWETLLSSACEFPMAEMRHYNAKPLRFVDHHM